MEDARHELAESAAEVAKDALLERGVILRATEEVGEQLAEDGVALEELDHAGGDSSAEERAAVEAADDAGGKFELKGEGSSDAGRVGLGAAFRERAAKNFTRAHGIKEAFPGKGIDPGGGVAAEGPVFSNDSAVRKSALLRGGEDVAVEFCAGSIDFLCGCELV